MTFACKTGAKQQEQNCSVYVAKPLGVRGVRGGAVVQQVYLRIQAATCNDTDMTPAAAGNISCSSHLYPHLHILLQHAPAYHAYLRQPHWSPFALAAVSPILGRVVAAIAAASHLACLHCCGLYSSPAAAAFCAHNHHLRNQEEM